MYISYVYIDTHIYKHINIYVSIKQIFKQDLLLLVRLVLLLFSYQVLWTLFTNPWIIGPQAPLTITFPRQEYWSGLQFPSSGDLST